MVNNGHVDALILFGAEVGCDEIKIQGQIKTTGIVSFALSAWS